MYINNHFINRFKSFSLLVFVIFLTACNSSGIIRLYDGAEKNKSQISTFILPLELEVEEVNGKEMNSTVLTSADHYQLQVLPGKQYIKAVYIEYWGSNQSGGLEKSASFYFVVDARAGADYQFEHDGPTDLLNAPDTNSIGDVKLWILDRSTGNKINPAKGGQGYSDFLAGVLKSEQPPKPVPVVSSNPQEADPAIQQTVETQLQYWWNLADEKQRERFQQWLKTP